MVHEGTRQYQNLDSVHVRNIISGGYGLELSWMLAPSHPFSWKSFPTHGHLDYFHSPRNQIYLQLSSGRCLDLVERLIASWSHPGMGRLCSWQESMEVEFIDRQYVTLIETWLDKATWCGSPMTALIHGAIPFTGCVRQHVRQHVSFLSLQSKILFISSWLVHSVRLLSH